MRILVTNDDGISAIGIVKLAAMAKELGEVTVIAPDSQCSAMSQKLSIMTEIEYRRADFPIEGIEAYTVSGTPADCVRLGVDVIMKDRLPDMVFSGINNGYNTGYDIAYSGTVGACLEGIIVGIPAIAFSTDFRGRFGATDRYLREVTDMVLAKDIGPAELWNLNFPGCDAEECKGILWDRTIAQDDFYNNDFIPIGADEETGTYRFRIEPARIQKAEEGTDIAAVLDNYVSIGKISSNVVTKALRDRLTRRGIVQKTE